MRNDPISIHESEQLPIVKIEMDLLLMVELNGEEMDLGDDGTATMVQNWKLENAGVFCSYRSISA